jgi:hypothetical protein
MAGPRGAPVRFWTSLNRNGIAPAITARSTTVIDLARIAEYRRHADDCRKRALETKFLDLKRQWEDLARQYDEMADRAEQFR